MDVLDVLTSPWAITPDKLRTICDIYDRHLRGETADLEAIEAAIGKPLDTPPPPYTVVDGVATIPIVGVIAKRLNLFSRISGGVSTQLLQRDIQQAIDDEAVDAILLEVDSPGGEVDGTQTLAQFVREAAAKKPVAVLADGLMASAGYWIGSAVGPGMLFISGDTTAVGSIGVVAAHIDRSESDRQRGLKVTEITSGAYKRIAGEHAPLTPEGYASIKAETDHIYSVFVEAVAAHRGVDVETVLEHMADGRVFYGQKAVTAGLVDGVMTQPAVMAALRERGTRARTTGAWTPIMTGDTPMAFDKVTILGTICTTQEAVDAALTAALKSAEAAATAKATADVDAKVKAASAAAATAERERILAIEAAALPGHETLVAALKADSTITAGEAATRILAAEKARLQQTAAQLHRDAPPPADASEGKPQSTTPPAIDPQQTADAARHYQAEQQKIGRAVSMTDAVAHVMAAQKP